MVNWRTLGNQYHWSGGCCTPGKGRHDITTIRGRRKENGVWAGYSGTRRYWKMKLDPKKYGLSTRVNLIENEKKEIILLIDRKSRIIMKDGRKILDRARKIQLQENKTIRVRTNAPVCRKTKQYLQNNGIEIRGHEWKNVIYIFILTRQIRWCEKKQKILIPKKPKNG